MFDWAKPITELVGLVREVVPDGDKRAEIEARMTELQVNLRVAELNTRTIPWVDALHKMQRGLLICVSLAVVVGLSVYEGRPIDWITIAEILGAPQLYIGLKGRGR